MPEDYHPQPTPEDAIDSFHDDDDSPEATLERFKKLFEDQKTVMDELLELSRDKSRGEDFQTLLDDIAYQTLKGNAEFEHNAQVIRANRLPKDKLAEVRTRQQLLFGEIKQAILRESGINSEAARDEMTKARENIRSIVESQVDVTNCAPAEVLSALGILQQEGREKERFTYPRGLFPASTDAKWDTYLHTVREHLNTAKKLDAGLAVREQVADADKVRRAAHNAVTRDVDMLLGLEDLPEGHWTLEDTRELLGKMRDSRFPNIETAEVRRTGEAIIAGAIGYEALKTLVRRCNEPSDHTSGSTS